MRVVFFGTYNTKTTHRVQVMIDGFRARGVEVIECNVPLPITTATRVAIARQPWRLPVLAFRILQCWFALLRAARRLPPRDAVVVGYLGHFDVHLARWIFRRRPIALDYLVSGSDTVRDRNASSGLKDKLLVWLDKAALRTADIAIGDTQEHLDRLPEKYRHKGVVALVGAPQSWFDAAAAVKNDGKHQPLRVIFFGLYTPLHGTPTIGKALSLVQEKMDVTMAGTGQDEAETKRLGGKSGKHVRITWLDWVNAPEIATHDVCLGIFGTGPKSYRVVPNKMYQGAALRCALVTADTPPQRRVLSAATRFVAPGDAQGLADVLDGLARHPAQVAKLRTAAQKLAQQQFTPQQVIVPLLQKFQEKAANGQQD